jgi:plasmid stabilization system protein ParE
VTLVVNYKVKKSHHFDYDIEKIHAFLIHADYPPDSIRRIFDTIYTDMKKLRKTPKMGAELSNKTSIPNDYRYLVSGQYLIFYKVFEKERVIRVYHIYHSKEQYLVKLGLSDIEYHDV